MTNSHFRVYSFFSPPLQSIPQWCRFLWSRMMTINFASSHPTHVSPPLSPSLLYLIHLSLQTMLETWYVRFLAGFKLYDFKLNIYFIYCSSLVCTSILWEKWHVSEVEPAECQQTATHWIWLTAELFSYSTNILQTFLFHTRRQISIRQISI